jgi:hypothetical protein
MEAARYGLAKDRQVSEYQYYEFQAIDRPLTSEEQEAVARLSSRVDPHPRRAVFTYSWSDFPGNPRDVLARYYDAMLYMANWGSIQLMFRFPRTVLDLEGVQVYCQPLIVEDYVSFSAVGEYVVLNIEFHEEGGGGWIEGEGWLDALLPLRDDILRGDYRLLYLAWLKTTAWEDVLESVVEPPVPPGLKKLTRALETFVELFEIDETLIQVAAEASAPRSAAVGDWMRGAIAQLPREEGNAFLLRLAQGEPYLGLALKTRLRALVGKPTVPASEASRRTVGQLLGEAERRHEVQRQRRAEEAERKRIQKLDALAAREAEVWSEVHALIERKNGSAYDTAVRHLCDLRELARYKGRMAEFGRCIRQIREQYYRRPALLRRLDEARL